VQKWLAVFTYKVELTLKGNAKKQKIRSLINGGNLG
jgi:hypothetical protein